MSDMSKMIDTEKVAIYLLMYNYLVGVIFHAFEWFFVRLSPFVLIGSIIGICITRKNRPLTEICSRWSFILHRLDLNLMFPARIGLTTDA